MLPNIPTYIDVYTNPENKYKFGRELSRLNIALHTAFTIENYFGVKTQINSIV